MPQVFDDWLADPKSHTYGVEADGRIVAIGNMRLVDDRKTGWMEGLRVHPDYRKRGLADMLTRHFVDLGTSLKVKRLRYSTGRNNRASLRLAKNTGFKRLLKMSVFWYEDLKEARKLSFPRRRIISATPGEAFELSKSNPLLFPKGVIVFDWKVVDADLLEFKEIGKDHTFSVTVNRGKLTGLSLGHRRPELDDATWSFTTYATEEEVFLSHFGNQIRHAVKLGLSDVACTCPAKFEESLEAHAPKATWQQQLILLEKQVDS